MNKREAYAAGKERGWTCASWTDLPELGQTYWTDDGKKFAETKYEAAEIFAMTAADGEMNARQYSPFEFFANELNENEDRAEGLWEKYAEGVYMGIKKNWIRQSKGFYPRVRKAKK